MTTCFRDRADAGRRLAERLEVFAGRKPVVVGLPRGGVPVAAEIARTLRAQLDIVLVRKVGVPHRSDLAAGAVGEDGVTVRNDLVLRELGLSWEDFRTQVEREHAELRRRAAAWRTDRKRIDLAGRTVIVVDDGIATGSTVVAAMRVVRDRGAKEIVLAIPVAPPDAVRRMTPLADTVVCLHTPTRFFSVGQWFENFRQIDDGEVRALLDSLDPDA